MDLAIGAPPVNAVICNEEKTGVCGPDCQARVQTCMTAENGAFVMRWTNNMTDGVGTIEAFVHADRAAEIRWLELTMVSGYDPHTDTTGTGHVSITEATCTALAPAPAPGGTRDVQLRCVSPTAKRTVCSEPL